MQRAIRLGLVLSAALAFTPAFADLPGSRNSGSDNSDESMPPVAETQATQPGYMEQAISLNDQGSGYLPSARNAGGDNADVSTPPVEEMQAQAPQQNDTELAKSPDQNGQDVSAGAASGEPDRYDFQNREEHGHGYK